MPLSDFSAWRKHLRVCFKHCRMDTVLLHNMSCPLCFSLKVCKDIVERLRSIRASGLIVFHKSQCSCLIERYITRLEESFPLFENSLGSDSQICSGSDLRLSHCCRRSLLRMEGCLKHGEAVVISCTDDRLWLHTAHKLAIVAAIPLIPRFSAFGLMIREFEGFVDIAILAFNFAKDHPRKVRIKSHQIFGEGFNLGEDMDRDALDKRDFAQILEDGRSIDRTWLNTMLRKLKGPPSGSHFLPPGYQIDRQSVTYIEHIGMGSYGIVDKSEYFGMPVAVKNFINIPNEVMEAEAALLAAVQHPNVVQLIGCARGEKTDTGMLVMELMECDLRKLIDRSSREQGNRIPFKHEVAVDIISQIAEAMLYLKECRVIHRDLRAANVLVNCRVYWQDLCKETEEPYVKYDVKLADFGMSKYGEPENSYFATKQRGATLWRAPEVFDDTKHASNNYTWSADVYSFGMTCYEIITGCIPFEDVKRSELLAKIRAGARPEFSPSCPSCLTELVKRCWALNPDDRPDFKQICEKLWSCRLRSFFEDIPIEVSSDSSVPCRLLSFFTGNYRKFRSDLSFSRPMQPSPQLSFKDISEPSTVLSKSWVFQKKRNKNTKIVSRPLQQNSSSNSSSSSSYYTAYTSPMLS